MMIFPKHRLMAEGEGGGGAAVAEAPAPAASAPAPAAPSPAPAAPSPAPAAPSPAPAAPSPAPAAPAPSPAAPAAPVASLLKPPPKPGEAPAAAPAPTADGAPAWLAKVPEKSRVVGADGKPDAEATLAKLGESYTNLEKLKGPALPASPSDYTFQAPERFKDLDLGDVGKSFREKAHKAGITQAQFELVMGEYFELVPGVLDSAAKITTEEARTELQKVWKSAAEFEAGIAAAQRAVDNAPAAIREDVWTRFGRDPAFLQFAASIGKEMQEDRPPQNPDGGKGGPSAVEALMASKAYRDPKDPQHAAVSAQVRAYHERVYGSAPVV